jgi:hypothetical protein
MKISEIFKKVELHRTTQTTNKNINNLTNIKV